ncbi:MAG: hypothetical protein IT557_06105 [Alphaproteobacteria bacterium]|nr:hypothetical protein [Alphaproteobacteria bacterium]
MTRFPGRSALLLAGALLLGLAGGAAAQNRDQLRIVVASPTESLDPHKTSSVLSHAVLKSAFEQLTRIRPDGQVEGLLATSWEMGPEPTTWTFRLRQGVTFHDGTPFNAEAVRANIAHILNPQVVVPARTNVAALVGAEVVDAYTVRIRTRQPFSGLPIALSHGVASMLSPASLTADAARAADRPPAGTGPFRIASFALPDEVLFTRNDNYWGEKPQMQRIEVRSRSNDQTRLAAFLSNEADVNFYVTPEGRTRVQADSALDVQNVPSIRLFMVHLPMGLPEMQDVRVRQALNHAIDRTQIVRAVFQGAAEPADFAIGPGVFGYRKGTVFSYDMQRAAALLREAGWTKGASGMLEREGRPFPTIRLLASRGRQPNDARLAQTLSGYLRALGVPTTLQIDEFATFFAAARTEAPAGNWMTQMAWGFPQMDGTAFLCSVYATGNSYNFGRYNSERVTRDCRQIESTFNGTERARLIAAAAAAVYAELPAIYVVVPTYLVGVRKGLTGLVLDAGENHSFVRARWQ